MGTVGANTDYLEELRLDVVDVRNDLTELSDHFDVDISGSRTVDEEYHEFVGSWDEKRASLLENLDMVGRALKLVVETMEEQDELLAKAVAGD